MILKIAKTSLEKKFEDQKEKINDLIKNVLEKPAAT